MAHDWEEFIYKKVSLWTGIIALAGTIISITWFQAGLTSELKLINQKLENHIAHISEDMSLLKVEYAKTSEDITQIKVDIAEIKALLK
jgi:hypothetical protein